MHFNVKRYLKWVLKPKRMAVFSLIFFEKFPSYGDMLMCADGFSPDVTRLINTMFMVHGTFSGNDTPCPEDLDHLIIGTRCYYINGVDKKSWFEARNDCHGKGGDLAVITDREQENKLAIEIPVGFYWFGLVRMQLFWTTGRFDAILLPLTS